MLAIVLALGAALSWGSSDFLGGLKTRTAPLLSVLLISQATALTLLATIAVVRGTGLPDPGSLGFAAIAGAAETIGIAALYRGLAVGTMSIVAPVAATAPVIPLLAGLAAGEIPGRIQLIGLALAVAGVVITSYRSSGTTKTSARSLSSILFGLLAAADFGTFFFAMDRASEDDIGWSLLTARLAAVALVVTVVVAKRHRIAVSESGLPAIALIGALIVSADAM